MKCLLIVDLQNDFCPGGKLAVNEGDKIVLLVNRLIKEGGYDLIIASKDWHPLNHISFASNHPGENLFSEIETANGKQVLWPVHCVQNTPGAEFHPALEVSAINKVILKGTDPEIDSYSAFNDNGKLKQTELSSFLEEYCSANNIDQSSVSIDVCGLALDYCVKATAADAAKLGYNVSVVVDATRSVYPENDLEICREMFNRHGIKIIQGREILSAARNLTPAISLSAT